MDDPYARPARPKDLYDRNLGRVEHVIARERFAICKQCPSLKAKNVCSECGCMMRAKTKLPNASCPLGKWGQVRVSITDDPASEPPIGVAVVLDGIVIGVIHSDDHMTAILLSNPTFIPIRPDAPLNVGDVVTQLPPLG